MVSDVSLGISIVSLAVAALTAWLTLLRRGAVRMTQPTVVYFGPDGGAGAPGLKVYFRTLLYATARRGRVIESMYVQLKRGETTQNFNIWVYGETSLHRGSGLFVSDAGIAANHHFLLPSDGTFFEFLPGLYTLTVFAKLAGAAKSSLLHRVELEVSLTHSEDLNNGIQGLYFDWGPDSSKYYGHIRAHPQTELPDFLQDLISPP
jgi:hypothetical protein